MVNDVAEREGEYVDPAIEEVELGPLSKIEGPHSSSVEESGSETSDGRRGMSDESGEEDDITQPDPMKPGPVCFCLPGTPPDSP